MTAFLKTAAVGLALGVMTLGVAQADEGDAPDLDGLIYLRGFPEC